MTGNGVSRRPDWAKIVEQLTRLAAVAVQLAEAIRKLLGA